MLLSKFNNVLKHTHSLSFVDKVKITGGEDGTNIQAIDEAKTAVIYGKLKEPIAELEGHTVGWTNMRILDTYCRYDGFDDVSIETRNDTPSDIVFSSSHKHHAVYRMLDEKLANELIRVPPFKGVPWDVTIPLQKESLEDLKTFASVLGGQNPLFTVSLDDGILYFTLGNSNESRTSMPFASGVEGKLAHQWKWPIAEVLSILKLGATQCSIPSNKGKCELSFSGHGALKITIDTVDSTFDYILPARQ